MLNHVSTTSTSDEPPTATGTNALQTTKMALSVVCAIFAQCPRTTNSETSICIRSDKVEVMQKFVCEGYMVLHGVKLSTVHRSFNFNHS